MVLLCILIRSHPRKRNGVSDLLSLSHNPLIRHLTVLGWHVWGWSSVLLCKYFQSQAHGGFHGGTRCGVGVGWGGGGIMPSSGNDGERQGPPAPSTPPAEKRATFPFGCGPPAGLTAVSRSHFPAMDTEHEQKPNCGFEPPRSGGCLLPQHDPAYPERRDATARGLRWWWVYNTINGQASEMKVRGSTGTRETPGHSTAVKKPELEENWDNSGLQRAQ